MAILSRFGKSSKDRRALKVRRYNQRFQRRLKNTRATSKLSLVANPVMVMIGGIAGARKRLGACRLADARQAVSPPSMASACPVIPAAASLAR